MKSVAYVLVVLFSVLSINDIKSEENNLKNSGHNKVKLVFRCDDYLLQNSMLMDSIIDVFQKNDIPVSLGVVPLVQKQN
jgi:hypothetical protein